MKKSQMDLSIDVTNPMATVTILERAIACADSETRFQSACFYRGLALATEHMMTIWTSDEAMAMPVLAVYQMLSQCVYSAAADAERNDRALRACVMERVAGMRMVLEQWSKAKPTSDAADVGASSAG